MRGACAAVGGELLSAVVSAVASMGLAGELSWGKSAQAGTGSLHIGILDALSQIDDELLEKRGKVSYEE